MKFIEKLQNAWEKNNSLLCVGLDPNLSRFPAYLKGKDDAIFQFCSKIIDATADLVCAYKPQIAYFHAIGAEKQLEQICDYIGKYYPEIPIILDAKRGDIGATAQQYAKEAFQRYHADAVTVNPYMGYDSVEPYFEYADKGVIVLCRTSNPGGSDVQFLNIQSDDQVIPLYQYIAKMVSQQWNKKSGQCALVVGATFPNEIAKVREIVDDMPLLIPGIGAQGGSIEATVQAGKDNCHAGMMINSSRAILYPGIDENENFMIVSRQVASETRNEINRYR